MYGITLRTALRTYGITLRTDPEGQPKRAPRRAKRPLRAPKRAHPNRQFEPFPKDGPRDRQQEAPKTPQEAPMTPKEAPQMLLGGPRENSQDTPRSL